MRTMSLRRVGSIGSVGAIAMLLVAGCGGAATSAPPSTAPAAAATATASPAVSAEATAAPTAASTPTAAPTATVPPIVTAPPVVTAPPDVTAPPAASASPTASAAATAAATASPSLAPTATATLTAPATVEGGAEFAITWTGPDAPGDYVTLMASGALRWTNEPYFYTTNGNPGKLVAPTTPGDYELWYADEKDTILGRRPITVTPFQGALTAVAKVAAGSTFKVTWTGPDGPRDYVTIVAVGVDRATSESYFYTTNGNPGKLIAPIVTGAYELWYVTGTTSTTMVRRPITVTPLQITLKAVAAVTRGRTFKVTWTGPNGPGDYLTIVPVGSPVGTYASWAYTANGSPATLTAPAKPGKYEIWYASDRVKGIFKSRPIVVR
jgi:Ca-activated chloride channel family protein